MPLTQSPHKTYIDVMVFIYHLLYDKSFILSRKSENFFKDVEAGNIVGVVSSFSVAEYVGVMKRFISKKLKRPITLSETRMLKEVLTDFISKLGIILYNSDDLVIDASGKCSIFYESGILTENSKPSLGVSDRKWHTLCGADALHTLFAIRTNSSHIATFDQDFKDVEDQLTVLNVWEEY